LTDVLTKPTTIIEKKIGNAIKIFGIETSIMNQQVRFVLLVTCLEGLLMTGSNRDYLLWKLAEKTAFLLDNNKRKTNDYVKSAYRRRSSFVHGSLRKNVITKDDVRSMENLVTYVVWKLMDFRKQGYVSVQKKSGVKSIDEYIEEIKFGKK